jgi:ubiquitin-like protein Pup
MAQTQQPQRRPPATRPVAPVIHDTAIVDDMDALLDEIDSVLEENALEVTRTYRQRGGQ